MATITPQDHRKGKMGRPHALDDSEFAKNVAQLFVNGLTRAQIAAEVNIKDLDTITRWGRDPRVRSHIRRLIEQRVQQITRKVDGEISKRLENATELSTRELLEIRKEFLGGALREQTEKADDEAVAQAVEAVENNPEIAQQLRRLLAGKTPAVEE